MIYNTYVTWFWKTNLIVTFNISRNTDLKYWMRCGSLMMQYSYAKLTATVAYAVTYTANTYFIANSTSYLNDPGFRSSFFNGCNIVDWVYRGWAGVRGGVGSGSGWGAVGGLEQTFKHKWQCYAIIRWPLYNRPSQGYSLHLITSTAGPLQFFPPQDGAGLLHDLVFSLKQEVEQFPINQSDHPPSTTCTK